MVIDMQLRKENQVVTVFDDSLRRLAEEMLLVMYASDGIGLAAPQVGVNKRIMVFNEHGEPDRKEHEMVLVNPSIVSRSDELVSEEEGCLSFPQIRGNVDRHVWIEVKYQDITGKKVEKRLEKFPAIIFQHEYDHLDKVLYQTFYAPSLLFKCVFVADSVHRQV
ncbi:peptide deformylase [archaeon]|nr:MAG: peptide deformylase [archaeon]